MLPRVDEGSGWIVPPPLRPGDVVRVVAPSGPFEVPLVWRGLGFLRERYRLRFDRGIFSRQGYLAGDDARRRDELARALVEPGVAAIFCARGGYGASRYAHAIDWSALRASPRWIIGFSDVTALHVEASAQRVASLHGPNLTGLGRSDAVTRERVVEHLEDPHRPRAFSGLTTLVAGSVEGPLFGGNLTLLHACAAAGRLHVPRGAVLLLEDVTERPYRLDRMLATLVAGGHLQRASAIVLGDFTDCRPGPDGVTIERVVADLLVPLGIPLLAGAPIGHGAVNTPVVLGARARVAPGELCVGGR